MGCGNPIDKISDALSDFDDHVLEPIKNNPFKGVGDAVTGIVKHATGQQLMRYGAHKGWVSDGFAESYDDYWKTTANIGMAVGGVLAAPITGGASLGVTYGVMTGAGMGLLQGQDWGDAMTSGIQGGVSGAVGGAAGKALSVGTTALAGQAGSAGLTRTGVMLSKAADPINGAVRYGVAGGGGAYGATGDMNYALKFGAGSAIGGAYGVGKYGILSPMAMAPAAGLGFAAAGGAPPPGMTDAPVGAGGGGGRKTGDANSGTTNQSRGTKSVPEAQFLDGGGGDWGNAGVGGVFGGLDNLRKRDKFIDTDKISDLYSQRAVGAFAKV